MKRILLLTTLILLTRSWLVKAQSCENMDLRHVADIPSLCTEITMTMEQDPSLPFLYVASKEGGLKIYDISDPLHGQLVVRLPVDSFRQLDVMNLFQSGNFLYLALGNHFNEEQNAGMAIVDVSQPGSPRVMSVWEMPDSPGGSGIIRVQGDHAYLGAMGTGLVILDVSDKTSIHSLSVLKPDINYPTPNPTNKKLYNARGIVVHGDILYLCYDAGGLRIINISDRSNPRETGRYSNPALNGKPRAYNNIVLDGDHAFIAVDYCGLEVLNVSDTAHIALSAWWNPWHCETNPLNWFSSPGYANELAYDPDCKLLFVSTGRSDMYVLNMEDPLHPDSCTIYGGVDNNIGTWGVSSRNGNVFLSYICSLVPFSSNWTGVKMLRYNTCSSGIDPLYAHPFSVHPNPFQDKFTIDLGKEMREAELCVRNAMGQVIYRGSGKYFSGEVEIKTDAFPPGFYFLTLRDAQSEITVRLMRAP